MDVTYRVDKEILYIAVEGRIDASNAAEAEEKIFAIKNAVSGKHVVVDADKLEYISSAGLRVILRLRKEEPKLAIINVAADVYEVFEPPILTTHPWSTAQNPAKARVSAAR